MNNEKIADYNFVLCYLPYYYNIYYKNEVSYTAFTVNVSTGFIFRGGFTLSAGASYGLGSRKGRHYCNS